MIVLHIKNQQKIGGPLIFEYIKSKKDPLIETNKKGYILYMSRCECGCGGKASKKHMCVRSACGQKPQSATCVRATEKSSPSNTLLINALNSIYYIHTTYELMSLLCKYCGFKKISRLISLHSPNSNICLSK